jgi:hypothetical protein
MVTVLTGSFVMFASGGTDGAGRHTGSETPPVQDRSVEAYRLRLLDLAFEGVSAMPLRPHIKNRSRAQQDLVEACLTLGQPEVAAGYVEQMANWQRWLGYANVAAWYAEQGDVDASEQFAAKVRPALTMSEDIRSGKIIASVENPLMDSLKGWRYEAVLTRLEEVRRTRRDHRPVVASDAQYGELNAAQLNAVLAVAGNANPADALAALKPFITHPNFEVVYFGLQKMAEVADAHYAEIDLPQLVKDEMTPALNKMPVFMQLNVYAAFAGAALDNGDTAAAKPLLEVLGKMVSGLKTRPRNYIPEAAKYIRLLRSSDEPEKAAALLETLLPYYQEKRPLIVNIDRAALLCDLAELYHEAGNAEQTRALYLLAIEEGQVNPNSRPRAEDLNRICCSMALTGFEPDAALWSQLEQMRNALGDPW